MNETKYEGVNIYTSIISLLLSMQEAPQSMTDVLTQAFLPQDTSSLPEGMWLFYNEQKRKIGSEA